MKTTHLPTIPFEVHPTSVSGISLLVLPDPLHHTPQMSIQMQTDLAKRLAHAANTLPALVEALRDAIEILEKDFDYRPDDGNHWDNIKAALATSEEVKDA